MAGLRGAMVRIFVSSWILLGGASVCAAQEPTLAELVKRLATPTRERSEAYMELRRRNDARVIPLLVEVMPTWDPSGQSLAVYLLEMFRNDASQNALAAFARRSSPRLRVQCAVSLVQQGRREFLDDVLAVLRQEALDDATRSQMLPYLSRIDEPEIGHIVRAWIDPSSSSVVLRGAIGLVLTNRDVRAREALERVADASVIEPSVRALAVATLLALGAEDRVASLVAALGDDAIEVRDWYLLGTALRGAARLPQVLLDALTARLDRAEDVVTTRNTFEILAHFRHQGAIPVARKLMSHEDAQVAREALQFLLTWPGALQASALRAWLTKDDPEAILQAAEALLRMDDASGFDAVSKLSGTKGHAERAVALRLLGRFRKRSAIPILLDALEDEDVAIRRAGEQALEPVLRGLFPYRRLDLGSTGYSATGSPADRARGVAALRAFWETHR